jgi:hypothetical protein
MANLLLHRLFKFPGKCSVDSVVVRETNGIDEQAAALAASTKGGQASVYTELVRQAIVEVNGQKIQQPYMELEQWNSKTRALLMKAYEQVNELPDEQLSVFLAASEDVTPGLAVVEKSDAEKKEAATR